MEGFLVSFGGYKRCVAGFKGLLKEHSEFCMGASLRFFREDC